MTRATMTRATMTARPTRAALALASVTALLGSCNALNEFERRDVIELDKDLRTYASDARANLAALPAHYRVAVAPMLAEHEHALRHFDRVMAQGQTRRAIQTPLLAASATLLADDVTGVGVANDIAIPFLALGVVAVNIATSPAADRQTKQRAYQAVVDSAKFVSEIMSATSLYTASQQVISLPGERKFCIDMYVDCQINGHIGFPRSQCQPCMDLCLGQNFRWPRTDECKFK